MSKEELQAAQAEFHHQVMAAVRRFEQTTSLTITGIDTTSIPIMQPGKGPSDLAVKFTPLIKI